jgi:competence ComEA-like helix-hairpin-helix protein
MKQFRFTAKPITWFSVLMFSVTIGTSCVRRPHSNPVLRALPTTRAPSHININSASAQEMEQLPGVGKVIAERIIAYREQYGRFRRPEELLMVNGVSDKKFRAIQALIVVD